MPIPRYSPEHDFTQDEALNVSGRSTLKSASIDTELGNIESVIDAIAVRLEGVTRDDGDLADGCVTVASMSTEAKSILSANGYTRIRGDWAASTAYAVGDYVVRLGMGYLCTVAHTSSGSFDSSKFTCITISDSVFAYDVRWFGGVSGGTSSANATAFSAAVTAAIAGGVKRVYIPFDSWTLTTGTDAQGCIVAGNGVTALTGVIGASRYDGCVISGVNQDYMAIHPVIPFDAAMKLLKVVDANTIRVMVQKPSKGYAYLTLKDNVTTNGSDSLGVTGADATMWRITAIQDAVEVLCGIVTTSNTNGSWTTTSLSTDVPSYDAGTVYDYKRSTTIGAWAEFTVTVPIDGYLSITFLESATASSDVTIAVDGVAIDSNFTTVSATARRVTRTYTAKPGSRVVRVTNNTAGSTALQIVGVYFTALKNARNDIVYDSFGVYRNTANIDPLLTSSANDLVLKDYNSTVSGAHGIYGGSFHGGESGISSTLYVGGAAAAIASGNLYVSSGIEIQQSCTITWAGAKSGCVYSGASVAVHTRLITLIGGYAQSATVTGSFTARELYTTLFGLNEAYDAVTFPQYKLLNTIPDTTYLYLGQNNAVEYHYAATGQRLRITHSTFTCPDSANGGAYVWRVVGGYCKYYSPWIWRGKRAMTSMSSVNIIQAS